MGGRRGAFGNSDGTTSELFTTFFRIREDSVSGHFSDEEKDETKGGDLVLLIEGAKFAFGSCLYLRCIQCHIHS